MPQNLLSKLLIRCMVIRALGEASRKQSGEGSAPQNILTYSSGLHKVSSMLIRDTRFWSLGLTPNKSLPACHTDLSRRRRIGPFIRSRRSDQSFADRDSASAGFGSVNPRARRHLRLTSFLFHKGSRSFALIPHPVRDNSRSFAIIRDNSRFFGSPHPALRHWLLRRESKQPKMNNG